VRRVREHVTVWLGVVALLGAYTLWDRWPRPEPLTIIQPTLATAATAMPTAPTATPEPLHVHVAGAVRQPGVYSLPPGSRLIDAVEAAGGLAASADPSACNLADRLADGQRVYLPFTGTEAPPTPTLLAPAIAKDSSVPGATGTLVNINSATATELDALPGIGPAYAQRIIDYRTAHGPFADPHEITLVRGIGEACYEDIKHKITTE